MVNLYTNVQAIMLVAMDNITGQTCMYLKFKSSVIIISSLPVTFNMPIICHIIMVSITWNRLTHTHIVFWYIHDGDENTLS